MSDSQRLRFILDGDDRLSRVLNHAGDSSARLHRRLDDDMDGNSRAVHRFTQDANGRLHDLHGRFVSVAEAQRLMGNGMPNLTRRLGELEGAGSGAASSLGSGGGLSGTLLGAAAAAGLSLLPALGALVPMLAGVGLAAGTLKLGFSGVGDALAASSAGSKEYKKALKELSPEQRDFTEALVGVKKEFGPIGREIRKTMLPGFTAAVKAASPVVKILGKAMTGMAKGFGDAARGVGHLLKDSGFQSDLQANLKLGVGFIKDMTGALGPFIRSLLDFGAASGPTLRAFSDGISGLLSKGLPGMFDGLKQGIPGAASMLNGLFSLINDSLLPSLGRLGGAFGKALGPLFGETFKTTGGVLAGLSDALGAIVLKLEPVFRDIGFGFRTIMDVARIIGPTMADTGSAIAAAFLPVGESVKKGVGPLQQMNLWVKNNKVTVLETAREFGVATIAITTAVITMAPIAIKTFRMVSKGILTALDATVSGTAKAFGWIPGIGGKLKAANREFDKFSAGYLGALDAAGKAADDFAKSATPKLAAGKLTLDINNWRQQIEAAKAKLKTLPPSKQAALKASIKDLEAKIARAKQDLADIDGKSATTYLITEHRSVYTGKGGRGPNANFATGGPVRLASGGAPGLVRGPGTGTSDSIPALLSNGEYIINAASTSKYLPIIEAINKGTLGTGRGMAGAGSAVAAGLASGMAASSGGVLSGARQMAAAVTAGVKAELEIASPSKKMRALAKDIGRGLILGLTGTRDKIRSTARDLAADIRKAFSGKKESSLLRMVDRDTQKLLSLAAKRDKIAARIAAAKAYASNVTRTGRASAGLSNLGMDPDQVTAGGIKGGLQSKLAQIKRFTTYINQLAKRGLNKSLLRQILDMGPDAGYAYASALAGADKSTFAQINSLQSQVDKSSASLGRLGADRLYDSGRNAGKGFLKGLEGQQKSIENLMVKIAMGMQKALRKALGINSPARKLIPDGINTAKGVAVGVLAGLPHVDRAMNIMAGRMTGRASLGPAAGRAAVIGGAGSMNVTITVTDARDPLATAREIRRELLELKRVFGMNVELKVG